MNTPLFSISIPTFNRGELLRHALRSIVNQTFGDFEVVVSDNWSTDDTPRVAKEFARSNARGSLVIVLNDDDVLLPSALERFAREFTSQGADFIFSQTAEYRDRGFPGPGRNTLDCPPFQGPSRVLEREEFLAPVFAWRPHFVMHPSAYVFSRALADSIAARCGRFFQSNGVEYCAWPLAAAFAKRIVHIDAPLAICGRTSKSWGSNLSLGRAPRKRIEQFIDTYYVDQRFKYAPLSNFAMANLRAEGYLTAKALFPKEFGKYDFNEEGYLQNAAWELKQRRVLGVDVSTDMDELKRYMAKYPELLGKLNGEEREVAVARRRSLWGWIRGNVGDLGLRRLRDAALARREARARAHEDAARVRCGDVHSGFRVSGFDFGFRDILGCADFLTRIVSGDPGPGGATPPLGVSSRDTGEGRVEASGDGVIGTVGGGP